MKKIIFVLFCLPFFGTAQKTNKSFYKAAEIRSFVICNYGDTNSKVISEKVIGVNVDISVDTVFNKYRIYFNDENGERTYMSFSFIRDKNKRDKPSYAVRDQLRSYQMKLDNNNKESYFIINDWLDSFMERLEIVREEKLDSGCVLLYIIRDAKRHTF